MSLAARFEHQPLLHALVQTHKRDVPWTVALRNTAAIILPLAVGYASGHLFAGLGISVGALNTLFTDQPGPYRLRLERMLLTAFAAGLAAFAGSVLGQWPAAILLAAAIWGFGAALLVAIDPHATRAGLTSLILLLVMGAEPHAAPQALGEAALIFAGGVLQTAFAIAAWPLQRYRPERLALAQAFRGLATYARHDVAHAATVALPPSLNDLQTLLFGAGRARGRAVEAFRVLAELAERIRIELFALAQQQAQSDTPAIRDALARANAAAAEVLAGIAVSLEQAALPQCKPAIAAYARAATNVETATRSTAANIVNGRVAALGGQLRAAVRNADTAGSRGEIRAQRAERQLPRALRSASPLATLRANLRLSSPACRHALRCGVCVAVALVLSHLLPLSRGYWMPMTVAIVLRPDFGATWRVGLLRVVGTLGGLLLTTAFLHFFGLGNFWIALALMAVLCFGFRELATVHYGIAVVCLTGVVVILLWFYGIPAESAVHARAIDTVLGSALALLAYFAWPTWERGRERTVLAGLVDAYADYLDATLHGDAQTLHATRIDARAARSAAQASLDRLRAEPASRANLPRAEALVAQANRLIRIAMELEAARSDRAAVNDPRLAEFARACDGALREAANALRESRAPREQHPLRALQQALEALPTAPGEPFATAVREASDRVVDAIDSLLHVLGQPAVSFSHREMVARSAG
ncbi:MAG TPA: FUSC family protein [Rhodanobacteraceae bacterium]